MIMEIAQIDVKPGMEAEFETGVKKRRAAVQSGQRLHRMALQKSHEKPQRYRLFVKWDTLENHTRIFATPPDFQEWAQAGRPLLRFAARCRACQGSLHAFNHSPLIPAQAGIQSKR